MTGVKACVFTGCLPTYHEMFSPLGGKQMSKEKPTGVIWHEAGRNDEDLASVYMKFMEHPKYRACKNLIFWADNCSAQNKNWTLFIALVLHLNNCTTSSHSSITFNFFKHAHSFMAADSLHHQIEGKIRSKNLCMTTKIFPISYGQ